MHASYNAHATCMRHTCRIHAAHMQHTCIHAAYTQHTHSTYDVHATCMQHTWNTHVLRDPFCRQHAVLYCRREQVLRCHAVVNAQYGHVRQLCQLGTERHEAWRRWPVPTADLWPIVWHLACSMGSGVQQGLWPIAKAVCYRPVPDVCTAVKKEDAPTRRVERPVGWIDPDGLSSVALIVEPAVCLSGV